MSSIPLEDLVHILKINSDYQQEFHKEESGNLKAAGIPVKALQPVPSLTCANPSCPEKNHEAPLSVCSGCRQRRYCSSSCQKLDWKKTHKKECKMLAHVAKYQEPGDHQDFHMYRNILGSTWEEDLKIVARSALRLGRPNEDIGETHYIEIHLSYESPKKKFFHTNIVGIRKMFTFQSAKVVAIEDSPWTIKSALNTARKLAVKKAYGHRTAYAIFFTHTSQFVQDTAFDFVEMAVQPDKDFYTRHLNPLWQKSTEKSLRRKTYPADQFERAALAHMEDIELYETPDYIEENRKYLKLVLSANKKVNREPIYEKYEELKEKYGEKEAYDMTVKAAVKLGVEEVEKLKKAELN